MLQQADYSLSVKMLQDFIQVLKLCMMKFLGVLQLRKKCLVFCFANAHHGNASSIFFLQVMPVLGIKEWQLGILVPMGKD